MMVFLYSEKHEVTEKEFGNDVHVQYLPIYPMLEETDSGSPGMNVEIP